MSVERDELAGHSFRAFLPNGLGLELLKTALLVYRSTCYTNSMPLKQPQGGLTVQFLCQREATGPNSSQNDRKRKTRVWSLKSSRL